jgi:uncharacterized membrane protein
MGLTFTQTWPLVLLALVPFVWWVRRRTLTNFHERQLVLQAVARSIVIGSLALALAQPVVSWAGRRVAVIHLVDASESVGADAVRRALEKAEVTTREGGPEWSRTLLFAGNAVAAPSVEQAQALLAGRAESGRPPAAALDRTSTDIEAALREALAQFPPGHLRRLVLYTDGRETTGRLAKQIEFMQREGVRVFTEPLSPPATRDAWVAALDAPEVVSADEPFAAEIDVFSHAAVSATVELLAGGTSIVTERRTLAPGSNRITLNARVGDLGPHVLEAVLSADPDQVPANDRLRRSLHVDEKPRVLYVEGRPASARYLVRALEEGGLEVDLTVPARLPTSANRLRGYAAVIVSDVNRASLRDAQMAALRSYVADLGGGFLLAGGESVYGADGYAKTIVEEILPVTFNMKDKPDEFALVIVLDKSWSMSGPKMELSKEAAKAAVAMLEDNHQFALIAFNNGFDWPVPMQLGVDRERIQDRISQIQPSGHTNIYPALEEAFKALLKVDAKNKHVILLSDGRTYTDDFQTLATRMADSKITVSSVAVGDQADRELLGNIATWGQGRAYYIEDAKEVPQIFTEETEKAQKRTLEEEPFRPLVEKDADVLRGLDFSTAPRLRGFTMTQLKETADLLLTSPDEKEKEPILARWHFGLGRTAAFLSDVKDRWAADWLTWPGYGKFWAQVVRDVMRQEADRDRRFRIERRGRLVLLAVDEISAEGTFPDEYAPTVDVVAADGAARTVELTQTGPGSYAASIEVDEGADVSFRLAGVASGPGTTRLLPVNYNPELQSYPADEPLLRALSADTGGAFAAPAADIVATRGDTAPDRRHVWPFLATLALLAYGVDLLLRRIRLFDVDLVA